MKGKRDRRWQRLRWPLLIVFLIIVANITFQQRWRIAPREISSSPATISPTTATRRETIVASSAAPRAEAPIETPFDLDSETEPPLLVDEVNLDLKKPVVRPKLSNTNLFEGVKGPIGFRVDGPEDAADERLLWELAPAVVPGSDGAVTVEIPNPIRVQHLARHRRPSARNANTRESKLRLMQTAVSFTTDRIERRFRFVLIVIAVRTQRMLDVVEVVHEWQKNCDDPDLGIPGGYPIQPLVYCTFAVVLPREFSNRTIRHFTDLLERDDSVVVVASNVSLTRGVYAMQRSGFEAAIAHFAGVLPSKTHHNYVLLTSVQFTPSTRMGMLASLLHQYEEASDALDPLARRVAGGASERGPILGCTLTIDSEIGERYSYGGPAFVIEKGVDFLYGNGDGGSLLNSLYAVRRLSGLNTKDDRVTGAFRKTINTTQSIKTVELPRGLEHVHAVSPYCAIMSVWVYRELSASDGFYSSESGSVSLHSILDDFEDAVGTGLHRARIENRSLVHHLVPVKSIMTSAESVDLNGLHVLTPSALTSTLFKICTARLQTIDHIRSQIRFSDVMSGSAKLKRTVSYFIRYLDDASRFHEAVTHSSLSETPREKILEEIPPLLKRVERLHNEVIQSHIMVEDKIAAALLYASRSIEALGRWYQQQRARKSTSTKSLVSEEAVMWDLCLRARHQHQIPAMVSNFTVRLQQHEYLSQAMLTPASAERSQSPIINVFGSGALLPVSSRVGGIFLTYWQPKLPELMLHPSVTQSPRLQVVWYTHCCHCCGFSNELQSLVYPLQRYVNVHLTAGPDCFCTNASRTLYDTLGRLFARPQNIKRYGADDVVIYISHTNPTLFHLSNEVRNARHDYFVGRSMYEFSKINSDHIRLANKLADEIWVPAGFVYHSYLSSGAAKEKLVIVPEAIDTHAFNPATAGRIELPPTKMFHKCNHPISINQTAASFKFLSDFKWEPRKGWDILFEAYFRAFTKNDPVVLFVLTHIWFPGGPETYGWANNITWIMEDLRRYIEESTTLGAEGKTPDRWPTFCIISQSMSVVEMTALYNSADAFVYTTRGEGWGLPAMQAMSMALPVIATNFGGVTEFLKPFNSFLIALDGVVEIPFDSVYGWSFGTKWAQPSVSHAAEMLKYVSKNKEHSKRVGEVARRYIVENFSEEALGDILNAHLQRIRSKVLATRLEDTMKQKLKP